MLRVMCLLCFVVLVESGDREFVVMNEPPGSGKSTLFTHDIPCWLIARDRSIRLQVGSRTERQARMYVGRIKRSLERDAPLRADAESLERGLMVDAERVSIYSLRFLNSLIDLSPRYMV